MYTFISQNTMSQQIFTGRFSHSFLVSYPKAVLKYFCHCKLGIKLKKVNMKVPWRTTALFNGSHISNGSLDGWVKPPHGLLWLLGSRIWRLRLRARRSKAWPMVPRESLAAASPSMLPLYQITQPPMEKSTSRAPEYTSRSPKSCPSNSSEAKTPSSMHTTPDRSITTANTRASLQWASPSYFRAIAATRREDREGIQESHNKHLYPFVERSKYL